MSFLKLIADLLQAAAVVLFDAQDTHAITLHS